MAGMQLGWRLKFRNDGQAMAAVGVTSVLLPLEFSDNAMVQWFCGPWEGLLARALNAPDCGIWMNHCCFAAAHVCRLTWG